MDSAFAVCSRPTKLLAKSLLDVWLSGDRRRLRTALADIARTPFPAETNPEYERIDLLKCVAGRMNEAGEYFMPDAASPRTKMWLDLLQHLSKTAVSTAGVS
jgi:hypothetical protein